MPKWRGHASSYGPSRWNQRSWWGAATPHSDPFDRLLIAQAIAESVHLVTHGARIAAYPAFVWW